MMETYTTKVKLETSKLDSARNGSLDKFSLSWLVLQNTPSFGALVSCDLSTPTKALGRIDRPDASYKSKIPPTEPYSCSFKVVQQNWINLLNEKLIILRCILCQMVISSLPTTLIKHLPKATISRQMYWLLHEETDYLPSSLLHSFQHFPSCIRI